MACSRRGDLISYVPPGLTILLLLLLLLVLLLPLLLVLVLVLVLLLLLVLVLVLVLVIVIVIDPLSGQKIRGTKLEARPPRRSPLKAETGNNSDNRSRAREGFRCDQMLETEEISKQAAPV